MKYLELIRLRTTGHYYDEIIQVLMETTDRKKSKDNHCDMHFFKNTPLKTDFLVVIAHETDMIDPHGSRIGQELCDVLKNFGLINHTTWTEV
jgi:hypothetical protein